MSDPARKPVVLILIGVFWPGNDSSGPNQSVRALCQLLGDRFEFRILASVGPKGTDTRLAQIGVWHDLGFAKFCYLPVNRWRARGIVSVLRETDHDILMLNSVWDRWFTLPALIARKLPGGNRAPAVLSTRGEFSAAALGLHAPRKSLYLKILKASGLLGGVTLHVTSPIEQSDVRRAFPRQPIFQANDMQALPAAGPVLPKMPGDPLQLVFVGRISPIKGLDRALAALALVEHRVDLAIYGPIDDAEYWRQCEKLIAALPPHIDARHLGEIANHAISEMLTRKHVLLLPSLSENFGYSIFEALAAACPVIIGEDTPWKDLQRRQAGWNVPVSNMAAIALAIDQLGAMDQYSFAQWRKGARGVAVAFVAQNDAVTRWQVFLASLSSGTMSCAFTR